MIIHRNDIDSLALSTVHRHISILEYKFEYWNQFMCLNFFINFQPLFIGIKLTDLILILNIEWPGNKMYLYRFRLMIDMTSMSR